MNNIKIEHCTCKISFFITKVYYGILSLRSFKKQFNFFWTIRCKILDKMKDNYKR